ncbi:MAG: PfkB family carbohydrate kinase, partial [Anaerolineae bacterium]
GGKGVYIADPETGITHLPAYTVPVVDTHGAGDAFIGAFAARLAWGDKLLEAVRYANAAGALMVMRAGPQSDDVTPDRIRAFLSGTLEEIKSEKGDVTSG